MTTTTTRLLVSVDTPSVRPGLNGELQQDIKTLAVDCLELMKRNSEFKIRVDVVELPPGTALTAPSEIVVQLIAKKPLLTTADVAQRGVVTPRTIQRKVKKGKFPRPVYVHGPRWRPEDIAAYETAHSPPRRD